MKKETIEAQRIAQIWKVGRLLIGETQIGLSKALGISQSNISKYESMTLEPSASDWYQFCQLAGLSAHKTLELGYIDGCTKFKSKLHISSSFKLPMKYRGDFAIKVREVIPFKECVLKDLGEDLWHEFLSEINIIPETFLVYDFQLSLRFIFDLADWYQNKKGLSLFDMAEKYAANLENHGVFKKQYSKQKVGSDLLTCLLENQPFYQRAFKSETTENKKSLSVKLVMEPEMYETFGEDKMRKYLTHKMKTFQKTLNQNTRFKGDFIINPNDSTFSLESTG
jgi:transcriptional regulator with XRE-family HTH domain